MISDLVGSGNVKLDADILIIGAGTAGLVMAVKLAHTGRRVVCVESGGYEQEYDTHPLNAVEHGCTPYNGAKDGRFRCLGGTSTRWGGALIPFQEADLSCADWPLHFDELRPYVSRVEELFDLPEGNYVEPDLSWGDDYVARLAKWPPFRRRNVFNLTRAQASSPSGPEIWMNATICSFVSVAGEIREVTAKAPDGASLTVQADTIIIAAGAIESTRLLLLADQQNGGMISGGYDHLGRYFHDHLSTVVADLDVKEVGALNRLVGFRFDRRGAMRNIRFELARCSKLRVTVVPCFAHVGFADKGKGGFDALRDVFRQLQRRRLPGLKTVIQLLAATPWLVRASWWRYVEKRLLYPQGAKLELHMVIEQKPVADNRITLSNTQKDQYGMPLARIDWDVKSHDVAAMQVATDAFLDAWEKSPYQNLATLVRRSSDQIEQGMREGGGIFHPGGATRMGISPESGVVDDKLRLFASPNVRVISTSVLPSGGGANPTMMLLILALRCADELSLSLDCNPLTNDKIL